MYWSPEGGGSAHNIPKDYDWTNLHKAWREGKSVGNTHARLAEVSQAGSSSDTPNTPDPEATLLRHQKPKDNNDGHKEESPQGNREPRQDMHPKETPEDKELKHKDDGHKEESPKGYKKTRQDMDPKETPQDKEPKHNDDGHKEE